MINYIGKLIKRFVFIFGILYGINLMLSNVDFIMPINIFTLLIPTFLGIPGLLSLFALLYILK